MSYRINGYELDSNQEKIILDDSKYLLVVAGAGSGKTLTILGKIGYLIKEKNINPSEILCISFTKEASSSLKEKIKKEFDIEIPVFTFHKLSLEIIKEKRINYKIADSETLENIIHLFFYETVLDYPEHLKLILKYFNKKTKLNLKETYIEFITKNEKEISILEKLISTFIHLFKCNNYKLSDYIKFLKRIKLTFSYSKYKKEKILLILSLNIYLIYMDYLKENNEIDFDDMIIKATEIVRKNYNKKIKYIIIDEYQDTSYVRFDLIKEIINKTNSKLLVVGDDYQSIYRFTGCDIDLFVNFKKYFKTGKIMKIENTYRNSMELVTVAGNFIMKNKYQIKKELHSNKKLNKPIKIIYYKNSKEVLKETILKIYNDTHSQIMILGRNNKDIYNYLDKDFKLSSSGEITYSKDKNIIIKYLTIHKSKGLESDNVIIINLIDDYLGLPCKIKDEKILRLVTSTKDKYPYSEERRLFYVGLTRTKNYVYLLVPYKRESIFIKELIYEHKKYIQIFKNIYHNR